MTQTCHLAWDDRVTFGSRQHFFHYMFGYLLPALHIMRMRGRNHRYVLESCGPLMDAVTEEAMDLVGMDRPIVAAVIDPKPGMALVRVPRWDVGLLRDQLVESDADDHLVIPRLRQELRQHADLQVAFSRHDFTSRLLADMTVVRSWLLDASLRDASRPSKMPSVLSASEAYLVLARSAQPAFYAKGGAAEVPGYGTGRRALRGVSEGASWLLDRGHRVSVFEPGAHTLREQIRAFHASPGVIGIQGAEFANVVWMAQGSKVVVIGPRPMDYYRPVTETLARLLNMDWVKLTPEDDGWFPRFDPSIVEPHLGSRLHQPAGQPGRNDVGAPLAHALSDARESREEPGEMTTVLCGHASAAAQTRVPPH